METHIDINLGTLNDKKDVIVQCKILDEFKKDMTEVKLDLLHQSGHANE